MQRCWSLILAGVAALGLAAAGDVARAQVLPGQLQFSTYFGTNYAMENDLTIVRPGGTNVTYSGLRWDANPFKSPPIYGLRVTYWLQSMPQLGFGIDFTHAKEYAQLNRLVGVSGTINGVPASGTAPLSSHFSHLEFTDGLNILTAHAFYRFPIGVFVPYVGIGVGVAIPHTEIVQIGFPQTWKYQLTGVAVRGYAGLEIPIAYGWSAFGEYQLSYEELRKAPLDGGGTFDTSFINHHFHVGISYAFKLF
jgi:lipid A oxidase